ncbi:MAG: ATP synthase F1 subunit delta [Ignavibacteriae bacterium]|nr:ATP synthase F1 subunit delta [Ignavibacteriota bacterium]
MKNTRLARRYAQAVMIAAEASKAIDSVANDLDVIKRAYESSRDLRRFTESPIISVEKKRLVFRELFSRQVTPLTMSFLELITEKQRESSLLEIIEQYHALRDAAYGIINIDVASAVEISSDQEKNLSQKLEQHTRKKVRVRFSLDKALKG